jgi:two-component system nitrogen regulation sensor histidine kinase GlnL
MKQSYSFHIDDRLRIISWGEKAAKLTGKSALRVLGKKYYEVLPRICTEEADAVSIALRRNKKVACKEYCLNYPGGQVKADITINPVNDRQGKGAKVTLSIHPDLHEPEGNFASAQTADIEKTATTLAHGIRNPLNAIKGAVYYIGEKYSNEPTLLKFTKIMEGEICRLDDFISRFLSISAPDTGFTKMNINALLKQIKAFTYLQLRACNIESVYEYGDIPQIKADILQLEQAILNVINNAMEAMGNGGRLDVKTYSVGRKDKDYIVIEILDSGPGISEMTGNICLTNKKKTRGYGLIITRQILENHGGFLEIKTKKGTGTSVILYLPVSRRKRENVNQSKMANKV